MGAVSCSGQMAHVTMDSGSTIKRVEGGNSFTLMVTHMMGSGAIIKPMDTEYTRIRRERGTKGRGAMISRTAGATKLGLKVRNTMVTM